MELLLLIIAVLLFMIFYRLGTLNHTYNLLYKYFNEMMLRFEEFNKEDFKVLRYLIYDLDKIMPFIVEKKQYEKRKWDFEEEDRKQEEEMRIDVESMRFSDKIEKERKEKEKKKQDDCWEINKQWNYIFVANTIISNRA